MAISRRHTLFALFSVGLGLLAFGPLKQLVSFSLHVGHSDSSHVLLIPFVSAVLLFWKRNTLFRDVRSAALLSVIPFAAAVILYRFGMTRAAELTEGDYLAATVGAVILTWLGGVVAFYGVPTFRAGLFPLLFLALAVPVPSRLFHDTARFLQIGSTWLVSALFTLSGTPAYRNDFVFMLPGLTIEVAEGCSGIRSTLGIVILTLVAAHLLLKSSWTKAALLAAAVLISLLKNAVRIATLSLLAIHWDKGFITGRLHNDGGIVFMLIGLALLYPVLALLIRSESRNLASGVQL